jgi:hypothetical protein
MVIRLLFDNQRVELDALRAQKNDGPDPPKSLVTMVVTAIFLALSSNGDITRPTCGGRRGISCSAFDSLCAAVRVGSFLVGWGRSYGQHALAAAHSGRCRDGSAGAGCDRQGQARSRCRSPSLEWDGLHSCGAAQHQHLCQRNVRIPGAVLCLRGRRCRVPCDQRSTPTPPGFAPLNGRTNQRRCL